MPSKRVLLIHMCLFNEAGSKLYMANYQQGRLSLCFQSREEAKWHATLPSVRENITVDLYGQWTRMKAQREKFD